jgi:membrane protease YdiL (CAAX protease family)
MKAHRTDTLSLVFGLIFVVVAGGFLAESYFDLELPEVGWFIAAGVIFVGVVTAAGALIPDRSPAPGSPGQESVVASSQDTDSPAAPADEPSTGVSER